MLKKRNNSKREKNKLKSIENSIIEMENRFSEDRKQEKNTLYNTN